MDQDKIHIRADCLKPVVYRILTLFSSWNHTLNFFEALVDEKGLRRGDIVFLEYGNYLVDRRMALKGLQCPEKKRFSHEFDQRLVPPFGEPLPETGSCNNGGNFRCSFR